METGDKPTTSQGSTSSEESRTKRKEKKKDSRGGHRFGWPPAGGGVQPGCMMKILEAERWLKGTNSRGVAFLQRRSEKTAGIHHPGAWKVEGHDA
jgi:hypothetical protein